MILTLTGPSGVGKGYVSRGIHAMFPSLKTVGLDNDQTSASRRGGEPRSKARFPKGVR